jgi:hypothetical protein
MCVYIMGSNSISSCYLLLVSNSFTFFVQITYCFNCHSVSGFTFRNKFKSRPVYFLYLLYSDANRAGVLFLVNKVILMCIFNSITQWLLYIWFHNLKDLLALFWCRNIYWDTVISWLPRKVGEGILIHITFPKSQQLYFKQRINHIICKLFS